MKIIFHIYIINIGFLLVWFSRFTFHLIVYGADYSKEFGWSFGYFWDFFASFFSLSVWIISRLSMYFLEKRILYNKENKSYSTIERQPSILDVWLPISAIVLLLVLLVNFLY